MRARMVERLSARLCVNICRWRGIARAMPDNPGPSYLYGTHLCQGELINPRPVRQMQTNRMQPVSELAASTGRIRNWHFRTPVELNMQIELRLCLGPRKFQEFSYVPLAQRRVQTPPSSSSSLLPRRRAADRKCARMQDPHDVCAIKINS